MLSDLFLFGVVVDEVKSADEPALLELSEHLLALLRAARDNLLVKVAVRRLHLLLVELVDAFNVPELLSNVADAAREI